MADPMHVYSEIKSLENQTAKAEADAFMQGLTAKYTEKNPAPPELVEHGLQSILSKYKHTGSGLEKTIKWGGAVAAIGGIAFGYAPVAVAGILAFLTPSMAKHTNYNPKTA